MNEIKKRLGAWFKGGKAASSAQTAIIIGLIVVVNIIVYVLDVYFGLYLYSPETDDLTISGSTDVLFADAIERGDKVKIMFCDAKDKVEANEVGAYVHETASQLAERYPDFIELEYVNIVTRVDSKGNYVDITKYQEEDSSGNKSRILESSVIFESAKGHKVLTDQSSAVGYGSFFTLDASGNAIAYNGEEVMASMVMWVLADEHKDALFTTYHGETADVGFATMLTCAGFNVKMVDLRNEKIDPQTTGLVVISNPRKDFERAQEGSNVRTEIEKLRSYVEQGGNLYVALDPYAASTPVLEQFLREFGIGVSSSTVEGKLLRNIVRDSSNSVTTDLYTLIGSTADSEYGNKISEATEKYNDAGIAVQICAALELNGELGAQPVLVSSGSSAIYAAGSVVESGKSYCLAAVSTYKGDDGSEGKVFVAPTVNLTATDLLTSGGYANREFIYSVLGEVFGAEDLPYGCSTVFYTAEALENLTMGAAKGYTVLLMAIPAAIAVVGAVIIIRRKNR